MRGDHARPQRQARASPRRRRARARGRPPGPRAIERRDPPRQRPQRVGLARRRRQRDAAVRDARHALEQVDVGLGAAAPVGQQMQDAQHRRQPRLTAPLDVGPRLQRRMRRLRRRRRFRTASTGTRPPPRRRRRGDPWPSARRAAAARRSRASPPRTSRRSIPDEYGPYAEPAGVAALISRVIRAVQSRLALRRFPLSAAAGAPPGRGLDVGCGRGDLAGRLVDEGWRMTGVEPSAAACDGRRGARRRRALRAPSTRSRSSPAPTTCSSSSTRSSTPAIRSRTSSAPARRPRRRRARRRHGPELRLVAGAALPRPLVPPRPPAPPRALHGARAAPAASSAAASRRATPRPRRAPSGSPPRVQYAVFGRCLFPGGMGLRIASGLCVLTVPLARLANRLGGGGDQLHVVATAARTA